MSNKDPSIFEQLKNGLMNFVEDEKNDAFFRIAGKLVAIAGALLAGFLLIKLLNFIMGV